MLQLASISSADPGGPRYNPDLANYDQSRGANHLLLCPSHHLLVDTRPDDYPVHRLREIKDNHFRRVKAQLEGVSVTYSLGDVLLEESGALGAAYHAWIDNTGNSSEEFWQKLFDSTPTCFMPALGAKPYVLQGKAYVGGKSFNNKGGNILDFLAFYRSDVACVEIKTPTTELMGGKYRDNSYLPGKELIGGVAQVLESRRSLLDEFNSLNNRASSADQRSAYDPTCFLIIGNSETLESEKVTSFELYRRNLRDVAVYTYDEIFNGIKTLLEAVGKPPFH
jgi:hypothetical protein